MEYEIAVNGQPRRVTVRRVDGRFVVGIDGRERSVDAARVDARTLSLLVEGSPAPLFSSHEVTLAPDAATGGFSVHADGTAVAVSFSGRRRRSAAEPGRDAGSGPERLVAPMPGKIVRVLVTTGDAVDARQPLVVIEAMKMENELGVASAGRVAEIHVKEGQSVDAGALLAVIHR